MSHLEFSRAASDGLRIGFLTNGWDPDLGGVVSHTRDLARRFSERGHRVHALCLDTSGRFAPFTAFDQPDPHAHVRRVAYGYGDHSQLFDLLHHRRLRDMVAGWLSENRLDVVHVHHLTGFGGGAVEAIRAAGVPVVMTLHDYWMLDPRGQLFGRRGRAIDPDPESVLTEVAATWPHLLPSNGAASTDHLGRAILDDLELMRAYRKYAEEVLQLPFRLLVPSAAAMNVFLRAGFREDRFEVVENGVEVEDLRNEVTARRQELPPRQDVRLGILGTVLPSKGALELAEAAVAAHAAGWLPASFRVEVYGNQPPYHGDTGYVQRLRELSEHHACVHLGESYEGAQLPELLANLDGVAAPSLWEEVYGLTVREARAAGLPVLVSDAGALGDLVTEGGGTCVARHDRQGWMQALRQFADPAQRAAWRAQDVQPRSTMDMALQLERVYAEAIEDRVGCWPDLSYLPNPPGRPDAVEPTYELEPGAGAEEAVGDAFEEPAAQETEVAATADAELPPEPEPEAQAEVDDADESLEVEASGVDEATLEEGEPRSDSAAG
ncbi:MAG: glycosyltransferase [Planctomycetota bacterium]|jgi:glycosyltransferase involved in cell wall biosynthesis